MQGQDALRTCSAAGKPRLLKLLPRQLQLPSKQCAGTHNLCCVQLVVQEASLCQGAPSRLQCRKNLPAACPLMLYAFLTALLFPARPRLCLPPRSFALPNLDRLSKKTVLQKKEPAVSHPALLGQQHAKATARSIGCDLRCCQSCHCAYLHCWRLLVVSRQHC